MNFTANNQILNNQHKRTHKKADNEHEKRNNADYKHESFLSVHLISNIGTVIMENHE